MAVPAAVKVGAGAAFVVGTPTTVYYSSDYINYYEVERKVMNEKVALTVGNATGEPLTIQVKTTNDDQIWKEQDGYYWDCTISVPSGVSITQQNLNDKLPISKEETDEAKLNNKKKLVYECSKNRTEQSSKKVKSKFVFPDGTTSENWEVNLFGSKSTPSLSS